MHQQSTTALRAGQRNSQPNPSRTSGIQWPPESIRWALREDQWKELRKLLDADKDLTLLDVFSEAVDTFLDSLKATEAELAEPIVTVADIRSSADGRGRLLSLAGGKAGA